MAQANITELLIIGGSAGALDVVLKALPKLNVGLLFPVVIVLHRKADSETSLEDLLSACTSIDVKEIEDKDMLRKGSLFLAPADYHILFEKDGSVSLDVSEKVHYCRPSIDVALESAFNIYKEYTSGILLSGANADGAMGLRKIKKGGGFVAIQDPEDAMVSYMPDSALKEISPDIVFKSGSLADVINNL